LHETPVVSPRVVFPEIHGRRVAVLAGMPRRQDVEQISQGKERYTKNGTAEIEVMANTTLLAPMHPRNETKSFANAREDDQHQASGAKKLERRGSRFFSKKHHR